MNTKYKLIACDLDGTFLSTDKSIHEDNIKAVQKFKEMGVHFAFCTGRTKYSAIEIASKVGIASKGYYGIAYNGAVVYSNEDLQSLRVGSMSQELTKKILNYCYERSSDIVLHTEEMSYYNRDTEITQRYYLRSPLRICEMNGMAKYEGSALKINILDEYENLLAIEKEIEDKFGDVCNLTLQEKRFIEFTDKTSSKGTALVHLANHLGVDIKDTIGIGDNNNDFELMKMAGVGVAMCNGEKELMKIADHVSTKSNNEGVLAEILEKFF